MSQRVLEALVASDPAGVAKAAAEAIASQYRARSVSVVRARPPEWSVIASVGAPPPLELAADALDREEYHTRDAWAACPLGHGGSVLMVSPAIAQAALEGAAADLSAYLEIAETQANVRAEAKRARTLLSLVHQWRQTNDLKLLLDNMADASCELFDADRASIFLWDRKTHTLVGRPAIGIEGGELRVPDRAGVVGAVLESGEPRRVSPNRDSAAIDHSTDEKTGYKTRSVLAAPLITAAGDKMGVFELLNKRSEAGFTERDQAGLVELAEHAAVALAATREFEWMLQRQEQMLQQQAAGAELVGACPAMIALRSKIDRVADTDLSVLILGENGCGKEVVARTLHYNSGRRAAPFVAVNCAAIAETLLESELFGHEKGAFTDARETRPGKFELADGGALLLDEIGDMSLAGQAKLLRALEEKKVVRVGGSVEISTDVRVLAATNQDLAALVREKRFREDLYFRLNVVSLDLPPLRQRGDDIMLLADDFLHKFCRAAGRKTPKWSAEARKLMEAHRWPGNVRELRNMMERLAFLTTGDKIIAEDLAFIAAPNEGGEELLDLGLPLTGATEEFQRRYIEKAIALARGNVSEAAKRLGVYRTNLYRKMGSLGMTADDARD